MNRVYKVIWSKAKHCYVVTSEIAKGYGKSAGSKGVKALLSGLVALSIAMGGYGLAGAVFVESKGESEGVYTTEVYTKLETNTELAKKADKATTLAGYGITDAYTKTETDAALNGKANTATTLEGYGITDAYTKTETDAALNGKADKATTLEGYGITDAYTKTEVDGKISAEENARKAADKDNLKVDGDGVISKVTGDDGTTSSAVNKLVLNKDGNNQITMDENGIKVGKNSTVIASDGVFAGGDMADAAKAALNANGSIKGANGDFEVNTGGSIKGAAGKFTVDTDGKVTANGGVDTNGGDILTRNGDINAGSGDISGKDITASGDISGKDISGKDITGSGTVTGHAVTDGTARMEGGALTGVTTITATGDISTGGDVVSTGGKVQGTSVSDGTATLSGGSLTDAVNITASGTITGNNVVVNDKLTTKSLEVTDDLKTDHITLGSETLNQTDINKGKVTSKVHEIDGAVEYTAESIFDKDGSSITARTDGGTVDSTGKSTVGAKEISQYLGNNAVPDSSDKNVTRSMVRNDDGTFSMEDKAVDEGKSSTVSQNAEERKVTVTDGTKTLTVTENLTGGIVSETDDGAGNKVTLTQGMDGTYTVVTSGTSTEEIGGQKIENYKGGLDTNITGDETHDVSGAMTTTVEGQATENFKNGLDTNITGDETHDVSGTMTTTVEGQATENFKDGLDTNITGDETHDVSGTMTTTVEGQATENFKDGLDTNITGDETHDVSGAMTTTVEGQATENFKNGLDTNITGNETHDVSGTMTTTVEGQATENFKDGLDTNITGDETHDVSGAMTTTVTGDSSLTAKNINNTAENGTITNTAQTVKTITGNNTVTSDNVGTTFANEDAKTPFAEGDETGTRINTKITGNMLETGKVLTDFAEVANNLDVKGSTTLGRDGNTTLTVNSESTFRDIVKMDKTLEVDGESTFNNKVTITKNGLDVTGGTTTDTLTVTGTSEFADRADFRKDVFMWEDLEVTGETRTGTLYVNNDGYVGGDLYVEGNIETHDAVLSADSRQVVTGRQLYQTNERVDRLDNRIKKVGANAAALAALRPGDFNPDDKFSIAAGFGSYRNANAAALGLFYRPNENVLLSLGTSFGDGENMVNAGVSVKFGRGKSMAERRKEMADEVSSMRDEMRSQDERIAELEEMLKKQSELIEKLSKES